MTKGVPLTDAELHEALATLQATGGNKTHAAHRLSISMGSMEKRVNAAKARGLVTEEQIAEWRSRESFTSGRRLPLTADDAWAVLDDFIGRSVSRKVSAPARTGKKLTSRIVIASDFHAPFHDPWCISELITRESQQTDLLIVAGDFTDSYSYSRFVKWERIAPEAEWAACDALMGQLAAAFPEIVFIQGNHDARLEKVLRSTLSPEIMFAIEQLTGGELDPCRALAKRYPNVGFAAHAVGRHGMGWLAQFGDLLVAHAEKFSRVPGSALRSIDEWMTDQEAVLGLQPWRILSQAHTHAMSLIPWKSDRLLVESGCLCETHGYMLQAKVGGRPQRRGYVTLTQRDGVTDLNSVRLVWLDAERRAA